MLGWLGGWFVGLLAGISSPGDSDAGLGLWTGGERQDLIGSISPYSPWDRQVTLSFLDRSPRLHVPASSAWLRFPLWIYTDAPKEWTASEIDLVLRLTRWYLGACKIGMDIQRIEILPDDRLIQREPLPYHLPLRLSRSPRQDETLAFLTRRVVVGWEGRIFRLLGLSMLHSLLDRQGRPVRRQVVWTRTSPIYTTLAHEIGHRLGLPHSTLPRNLMLNGPGVTSSVQNLWTSLGGFFSPALFGFTPTQCSIMRRTLALEQVPQASWGHRLHASGGQGATRRMRVEGSALQDTCLPDRVAPPGDPQRVR